MDNKVLNPDITLGGVIYTPLNLSEVRRIIRDEMKIAIEETDSPKQKKFIRGILGLAEFLGVSLSQAQKLKNSGLLPYKQQGRLILFEEEKVLEALDKRSK